MTNYLIKKVFFAFLLFLFLAHISVFAQEIQKKYQTSRVLFQTELTIGVLAPEGTQLAKDSWQSWVDALNKEFTNIQFSIRALDIDEIQNKNILKEIDFLLSNQFSFLNIMKHQPVRWIATLTNNPLSFNQQSLLGSAIWLKEESDIKNIEDLKNKKIVAVSPQAYGGFLLAYQYLYTQGLESPHDYQIQFLGYPVINLFSYLDQKKADAAIVPSCLFEFFVDKKQLKAKDYKLLAPYENDLDCYSTTPLLHNWSLAALPTVSESVALKFREVVFNLDQANLPQWQLPIGLGEVFELQRHAGLIQVDESISDTVTRLVKTYKIWLFAIVFIMFLLLLNHIWLTWLVRKRYRQLELAYQQLHEYEEMLSHADRQNILGEIASGIAHELNQPLMTIRNYAEGSAYGLKRGVDAKQFIGPMTKISSQVEHCAEIIKNLKNWARKKQDVNKIQINLEQLVKQVLEILKYQNKNEVQIEAELLKNQYVFGVKSILEQVLCNLILNAMQEGAKKIKIIATEDNNKTSIKVIDDGPGFNQAILKAPFVPFRTTKSKGLGLGLVICERLIRSLKGDIQLSNRLDGQVGAQVLITLPKYNQNKVDRY